LRLPLKSWNIPLKVAQFFSIRVNIFSAQRILMSNFTQTLGAFNETVIREMWLTWGKRLCQNRSSDFATEVPKQYRIHEARDWNASLLGEARGIPEHPLRRVKRPEFDCLAPIAATTTHQISLNRPSNFHFLVVHTTIRQPADRSLSQWCFVFVLSERSSAEKCQPGHSAENGESHCRNRPLGQRQVLVSRYLSNGEVTRNYGSLAPCHNVKGADKAIAIAWEECPPCQGQGLQMDDCIPE
jgi:hypothetical protein